MSHDRRFLTITWNATPDGAERTLSALPEARGVAVFEDDAGRTSLVATTANLRALVRRRLDPDAAPAGKGAVNLRAITSVVRAAPTGSAFESDLVYLEVIRARLAHVYRSVTDRWRGWFVETDPREPFPRFTKVSTGAMAGTDAGRTILGPVADKHAAARLIELLEDAFDLCRYHHILVQAPHGAACVYKEMGKCPAPCDGSETMDEYRARLAEAIAFARSPHAAIEGAEADMRAAAGAMEFERAEAVRKWIERAREATRAKFRNVRDLERFRLVAVAPSERDGWTRLIAIRGGRWSAPMDVPRAHADAQVAEHARRALDALGPPRLTPDDMDRLGLVCAWLARPEKSRRAVRFIWDDDAFAPDLLEAIRRDPGPAASSGEEEPHEIGAEGAQEPPDP